MGKNSKSDYSKNPARNGMKAVRLDTPRNLYKYDHRIAVYCAECERWSELKLPDIEQRGMADRVLSDLSFKCGDCETYGEMQIRTPAPTAGMAHQRNQI